MLVKLTRWPLLTVLNRKASVGLYCQSGWPASRAMAINFRAKASRDRGKPNNVRKNMDGLDLTLAAGVRFRAQYTIRVLVSLGSYRKMSSLLLALLLAS